MTHKKKELEEIIDSAARAVREEKIDDSTVDQSAKLVWSRISTQLADGNSIPAMTAGAESEIASAGSDLIEGCEDFQRLIPVYLANELSPARALLLKDHTGECVPCRRALNERRSTTSAGASAVRKTAPRSEKARVPANYWNRARTLRWSVAAAVMVCLGLAGMFAFERFDWSGRTMAATLEETNGAVYVISDSGDGRQLNLGEQLQKGEVVRTAKASTAVLRLADGSTVEMRERSEFSVSENRRGVTIRLERGDVIVEAAKQDRGRLYVQTPDSLVSVKGTIFAVESGTRGSRVSVVEGEVKVKHKDKDETLLPGDQTTTNAGLEKTSVQDTVVWSKNAAKYANLVAELASLKREINQRATLPGVRFSSRFLDLLPENTVFYAALPNLTDSLSESERVMQERIKQSPALSEWWKGNRKDGVAKNEQTLARIREFGSQLGEEIVVSAEMSADGGPGGVLVLGEIKDAAAFRTFLTEQLARPANETGDVPKVRIIDDPLTATSSPTSEKTSKNAELNIWIRNDMFAASPQVESLRGLAATLNSPGSNRFVGSAFHKRTSEIYRDGAGIVVAADIEKIMADSIAKNTKPGAERERAGLDRLGILSLRHFVAEQKTLNGKTISRAGLTFSEPRRGIASWLAAPGAMGALDFVSADANAATAFVVKEPALLVDDLFGFLETVDPNMRKSIQEIEKSQGIDIRNDFAAPLGGEFAFAMDGPILPVPSWKVVLEVYDQAKLQSAIERAVEKLNQFAALHGKGKLVWNNTTSGSRVFYTLKSTEGGLEVHYTFANGYLIAAPSNALLDQSIRNRDAGNTLVRSARFKSSLPPDGNMNFSAILYHDLAPLMKPLAETLKGAGGELTEEQRQMFDSIDANAPPTLVYAYAEGDRITFTANTEGGAFGLSPASLIGLPNSFEMQDILSNALNKNDSEKK